MSYAIIRNENYKSGQLGLIYRHNERKNTNYSNKDIDKRKMIQNYSLKSPSTTYQKEFNNIKNKYNLKGQIKSISNLMCEFIITSDKEFFYSIGEEETKRYFEVAYNFVKDYKNLGEQYIVSAKVHMDEFTPHMHILFIPVVHKFDTKTGENVDKIACSEYWKGKDSYRRLQDSFYKCIIEHGFDLERGCKFGNEHQRIEDLKIITNFEVQKFEQEMGEEKPLETNDVELLKKENKRIITKINKLSATYIKIRINNLRVEENNNKLKKVNDDLKIENKKLTEEVEKLEEENRGLKYYIDKTFEVVKHLFDFPKDRFKRIVDSFIISMGKNK